MNPWIIAGAVALVLWMRRKPEGITGDFVEFTPYLTNGAAAPGDATYIPQSTPREELHQPVPFVDGVPDGWALFAIGAAGATTYTRSGSSYYVAGRLAPGDTVFLRVSPSANHAGGADGPVDPNTDNDNFDQPWQRTPGGEE